MCVRLDPRIRRLLEESGEKWSLVWRTRHQQIMIRDVCVVTVPYRHTENGRCAENALAAVKRHLKMLRLQAQ